MMVRLTSSSLAGTSRTEVAVGTASEASMFSTTRAPAPRSRVGSGPSSLTVATARFIGGASVDVAFSPFWDRPLLEDSLAPPAPSGR